MSLAVYPPTSTETCSREAVIADIGARRVDATSPWAIGGWPAMARKTANAVALAFPRWRNHTAGFAGGAKDSLLKPMLCARALSIEQRRALHALRNHRHWRDISPVRPARRRLHVPHRGDVPRSTDTVARDTVLDRLGAAIPAPWSAAATATRQSLNQLPGGP